jgi:hypothetical protein
MLRRSSLVRSGPSNNRHRMVPFQRPSMTDSMASIGHGDISFFETGIQSLLADCAMGKADKLVSGSI